MFSTPQLDADQIESLAHQLASEMLSKHMNKNNLSKHNPAQV